MHSIETIINKDNGGIRMETTGRDTNCYPTVEALRTSLTREKFHLEVNKWAARTLIIAGLAIIIVPLISEPGVKVLTGYLIFYTGMNIQEKSKLTRPQVESKIKAFHEEFPSLPGITFSPREYLSGLKIPFIHP